MNWRAFILVLLALQCHSASAAEWGPWQAGDNPANAARAESRPEGQGLLRGGIRFFQKYISPVDGPRCPMVPTCSAYALQALEEHGPLLGTMMTVDRLLHETDRREHRHPVQTGDRVRYRDPLENNDFWFADR